MRRQGLWLCQSDFIEPQRLCFGRRTYCRCCGFGYRVLKQHHLDWVPHREMKGWHVFGYNRARPDYCAIPNSDTL